MSFSLFSGSGSNLKNFFLGSVRRRELAATRSLLDRVTSLHRRSDLGTDEAAQSFVFEVAVDACSRARVTPSIALGEALYSAAWELLAKEGFIGLPQVENLESLTLEEGVCLRNYLARKERFLFDYPRLCDLAREKLIRLFEGILAYLPASVLEEEAAAEEEGAVPLRAALIDLCNNPREVIERIAVTMFDADISNARLFEPLREQLYRNMLIASGGDPLKRDASPRKQVLPTESRLHADADVAATYLGGTPFAALFETAFPFHISFPIRFEHTHVLGGSGHGKTQLLQLLIHHDIVKSREDNRSVVVIDSQGDLIRTISHLSCFSPSEDRSLADHLVIIDPTDVEFPVCLNMFDFDRGRLRSFAPLEREKVLNGTIELYEYFFGALLGAELTQKQGVIFKYLARLMLEIPQATIHTFRLLMEDGEPFRPYMRKLPPSARSFFETRFFDRSFNDTKKQILTRLWGVLSNATFERMFSHPRNKVDLFEATNAGKIVLINTAKDLLQHEGSAIFGRFFIALLAQGAIQRSAIPAHERRPTFVYIDEAADYFDDTIEHLLNQARKYKVGMVLSHQNLDQLSASLRSSIFSSTSIKFAGGVSGKDATLLAGEMRCEPDFIRGMKKEQKRTAFACYVRNLNPKAVGVAIPLGLVDALPTMPQSEYDELVEANRALYCAPADDVASPVAHEMNEPLTPPAERPEKPSRLEEKGPPAEEMTPAIPSVHRPRPYMEPPRPTLAAQKPSPERRTPAALGRGGKQHQYLQQLFKQVAEERGFRAVIEEPILGGAGKVDIALSRGDLRIACEISVTTGRDQELGNIEKCLAAGYSQVVLVGAEQRHLNAVQKFIERNLDPADSQRVRFLLPEAFIAHLDSLGETPTAERTVRGYKVRVTRERVSPEEAANRRAEIAKVIARSMRNLKASESD